MRLHFAILFTYPLLMLSACRSSSGSDAALRIIRTDTLLTLPSASGITASGDGFLVNSDNAPFLYVMNAEAALQDSILLLNEDPSIHEIPKPLKPDYEAATVVEIKSGKWLLLLGSGSMSPHRDSALLVSLEPERMQRKASLRPFYEEILRLGIPAKSLNIEAATDIGDDLILFNRGNNAMIRIDVDSFIDAVFNGAILPRVRVEKIQLPDVNGFAPGISGAAMLNDSTVLFCGSVEATTDWAKDGAILGSGIGMIRLHVNGSHQLLRWTMLKDSNDNLLREKLEGIEVLRKDSRVLTVRCVTDNDNGSSTLTDLELRLQKQ